jgi:glycosyltransferase involved in cell wall biosynthesis
MAISKNSYEKNAGLSVMKLTCVTAVYNAIDAGNRDKLIRCIKSVSSLKVEHEHLIYDGASTDGTVDLLRELEAKTSCLKILSEKDTGLYNALNKGVKDAKGEWFYVLGCDDYIPYPQVVDDVLHEASAATDIIAGKVEIECNGQRYLSGMTRRRILIGMPYGHQGMLARTSRVREIGGFDERFRMAADYDMILKFHFACKKIVFIDKIIGVFSIGGMSTNGTVVPLTESHVTAEKLGLSEKETDILQKYYVLPFRCALRLLFHRDPTLRIGALDMLARRLRYLIVKIRELTVKGKI